MSVIKSSFPVSMEVLEKYFTEEDKDKVVEIDVNDEMNPEEVFVFLSNLDINTELSFLNCSKLTQEKFLIEYIKTQSLIAIPSLIQMMKELFLLYRYNNFDGKYFSKEEYGQIIIRNLDLLKISFKFLSSLHVYGIHTLRDEDNNPLFGNIIKEFEVIDDRNIVGLNLVFLLYGPEIGLITMGSNEYCFFEKQFKNNIYKGQPLFAFFSQPSNPINIALLAHVLNDPNGRAVLNEFSN